MGELDITIHTRDIAPCFSATPSHCQIVNWRAYPEAPSRAHALKKTRGGLIGSAAGGLLAAHAHVPAAPHLSRHYAER